MLAIALVGACAPPAQAAVSFRSASEASASQSAGLTLPAPTGARPGDVLVATVAVGGPHQTLTAPGWTLIRTTTPGAALQQHSYYRVVTASDPAAYALTAPNANSDLVAGVAAYAGVDNQAPIAAVADATKAQAAAIPTVTTTAPDQTVVGALSLGSSATVTFDPSVTARVSQALGKGHIEIADFVQPSAGPTPPKPATTSGAAGERAAQAIVLASDPSADPAAAPPPPGAVPTGDGNSGADTAVLHPVQINGPSALPMSRTGTVPVQVACALSQGSCIGTIEILEAGSGGSSARPAVETARRRTVRKRSLGRRKFVIQAGAHKTVPVRLSRRGRRFVIKKKKRKTRAKLVITTQAPDGTVVTTTKAFWIKPPVERRTAGRNRGRSK